MALPQAPPFSIFQAPDQFCSPLTFDNMVKGKSLDLSTVERLLMIHTRRPFVPRGIESTEVI